MSEMAPEGGGGTGGGNILTRKFAGMPGWLILVGVAVLAYFVFHKSSGNTSSPSSTSGSGQQTTGDISIGASTPSVTINAPYSATQTSTGTASATSTPAATASSGATATVPAPIAKNPQPTPAPKPTTKKNVTKVSTGSVTVAPWSATNTPWNSTLSGIAAHTGVSLATILKLNPQIKNPNVIYAGQKVTY